MWWVLVFLALVGCTAQVPEGVDDINDTVGQLNVSNDSVSGDVLNLSVNDSVNRSVNDSMNESSNVSVSGNVSADESNVSNASGNLSGNFVRFYMYVDGDLQSFALSEGVERNISGKLVEPVVVSSDGRVLLSVDGDLSEPLEEKESDFVGGSYVFIMEVLVRE